LLEENIDLNLYNSNFDSDSKKEFFINLNKVTLEKEFIVYLKEAI